MLNMTKKQALEIIDLWNRNRAQNSRGQWFTGWMPIEYFNEHEEMLRTAAKMCGHSRVFYRGPRISNGGRRWQTPTMTRRCDATHVVLGA